jgi:hypothetical protein
MLHTILVSLGHFISVLLISTFGISILFNLKQETPELNVKDLYLFSTGVSILIMLYVFFI